MTERLLCWFAKSWEISLGGSNPPMPVTASLKVKYKTVNLTDEGSNPSQCTFTQTLG